MEQEREIIGKKYAEVEHRLSKKDFIGNILYFPYDVDEEYFYTINHVQRASIMDQLNSEFFLDIKLAV